MRNKKSKSTFLIYLAFIAAYIAVIAYSICTNGGYIFEAIASIVLMSIFFICYEKMNIDNTAFCLAGIGLLLHDAGVFGMYGNPPVPVRWDLITHVTGIFAAAVLIYQMIHEKFEKNRIMLFLIVILASLGVGVIIEYIEFGGVLRVGEGEGVLGRGEGDFVALPGWLSADYLDTLIDQVNNLAGALLGFVFAKMMYKDRRT